MLKNIIKTIKYRGTIVTVGGSIITALLYLTIKILFPSELLGLSIADLLLLVAIHTICFAAVNYFFVTGKWTLEKWKKRLFIFGNIPSSVSFAYVTSKTGIYWPIGAILLFSGAIGFIGLHKRYYIAFFGFIFFAPFIAMRYFAGTLDVNLPFGLGIAGALIAYLMFIGMSSKVLKGQDEKVRRLLRDSRRDKKIISEERSKSDKLLLNILPFNIAEELKTKGSVTPQIFENASIIFTDFKGFTKIAEHLTPEALIGELDKCFSYFDSVCNRYGLEKLKTIGDAYMCAGGLPVRNYTHAIDCALAALEIQAFMNQMKAIKQELNEPYWELRLGIHTGPVVAGVIGEQKFAYDIWGDTVNTASRMESSGIPGKINISANTQSSIDPLFTCEHRGKVAAKNKGDIDMYILQGLNPEYSDQSNNRLPNQKFKDIYAKLQAKRHGS